MQQIIFQSQSKSDLKLLTDLAKKIGIETFFIKEDDFEDMVLLKAISSKRTKEYVNTEKFLSKLKNEGQD
jgi:hypothetical protein